MNDDKIKEDLLGRVEVTESGAHTPDPDWLRSQLTHPESVARLFCKNCGLSAEVDEKQFREFSPHTEANIPPYTYVETSGCSYCNKDPNPVEIKRAITQ